MKIPVGVLKELGKKEDLQEEMQLVTLLKEAMTASEQDMIMKFVGDLIRHKAPFLPNHNIREDQEQEMTRV